VTKKGRPKGFDSRCAASLRPDRPISTTQHHIIRLPSTTDLFRSEGWLTRQQTTWHNRTSHKILSHQCIDQCSDIPFTTYVCTSESSSPSFIPRTAKIGSLVPLLLPWLLCSMNQTSHQTQRKSRKQSFAPDYRVLSFF
jgi:hypothetical protein